MQEVVNLKWPQRTNQSSCLNVSYGLMGEIDQKKKKINKAPKKIHNCKCESKEHSVWRNHPQKNDMGGTEALQGPHL